MTPISSNAGLSVNNNNKSLKVKQNKRYVMFYSYFKIEKYNVEQVLNSRMGAFSHHLNWLEEGRGIFQGFLHFPRWGPDHNLREGEFSVVQGSLQYPPCMGWGETVQWFPKLIL